MAEDKKILNVRDLKLYFKTTYGAVQAVDNVSFSLERSRAVVVVGESGCGKTSLSKAILRLLPTNIHTYKGQIFLNGRDVMKLSDERFRREVRWVKAALVPQAAMNALNPVMRVEDQIAEPLLIHGRVKTKEEALQKAKESFQKVGIPQAFLKRYPFELSGGMRQRSAIAMALVTNPDLVVLDEPTSALDLLTQANIMNVLKRIKKEFELTYILITHDVATASEVSDDVAVMYAGQIVEFSDAERFFKKPLHPYSEKLMASVPTLKEKKTLGYIPGQPPSLFKPPTGCRFAERCEKRFEKCEENPPTVEAERGRFIKCWLYERGGADGE